MNALFQGPRFAFATALLLGLALLNPAQAQTRTAFVQLFEWKWTDVAKECEAHLGPKGFAAVLVSPPNEHNWVASGDGAPFPWWMRYQPVSYSLDRSRSGTRAEFADMVSRCNAVGVAVYADAVINHMSGGNGGTSSAGNPWSWHSYPRVPYENNDFHAVCTVNNYGDAGNVQNCELSGLQDLNTGASDVRGKIANYLVDLASLGVKGFRIDAAKHISPADLGAIIDNVNSRVSARPYWFLEVIGASGEAVEPSQYFGLNGNQVNVTEFAYGPQLYGKFAGGGKLAELRTLGESWGLMPSNRAVVFTDNHDKQRGHGGGGNYLTYHFGGTYDLANVFMLAWTYGYPVLMSSYAFNKSTSYDTSYGPPYYVDGSTKGPWDGGVANPACFNQSVGGWVCEHRFRPIANMVGFRNATSANWSVSDWWDNGNNQIAFGRGNLGFVVINKEGSTLTRSFKTSLPAGRYCDVISGDFLAGSCSGNAITVDSAGFATITAPAYGAAAIHAGAKLGDTTVTATFDVRVQNADPAADQSVYITGNQVALGNWDPCKAIKLTADNGGHAGSVSMPGGTAVQFKFIKYASCGSPVWEGGSNRTVTLASSGSTSVCGVFNSTAACSTQAGNASVTFNEAADTLYGQNVYVVGSIAALGNWSPASAVALTWISGNGTRGNWRATLQMPANIAIEYKYIKKDANGSVIWESGNNRMLNTVGAGGSQTLNDSWK